MAKWSSKVDRKLDMCLWNTDAPGGNKVKISSKLGGMVNFTLPSTTSEMISISTSQTFRSWVIIFNHRRPMACLSLNLYNTPGLAPRMNVLFWGPGDFPVSYSDRDTLWNAWNRHSGSVMVDTGILLSNMEYNPLTNVKWHSDPWPTVTSLPIRLSTNFMTFIPSLTSPNYEWFPWSICNGCG